ncbi:hypothetical protein CPAST_c20750 [Clostridium pasteurianum DSM 525 = ATCC 6013]|uniref:Uncharacterized protein n=1 Tax=Clostridium pasteurianum DSM 525 = ATCC 6013 TaxID=1262449 RepID=A0A0H3JA07_CLOPA|nr:hypothetical protein CPAST_c20750 [Clostridium pasteurianum DSM 525 = ATCC 6013]AJA52133.1 hypothetical protein CLPA_c20750 [Clostridium pasteurianum DSM 525 = ATCC 6013]KRU11857.1 hypothetical protein CP6013_01104 [Clostridium pasteurianum DSM 525 = ATCC 6013]
MKKSSREKFLRTAIVFIVFIFILTTVLSFIQ